MEVIVGEKEPLERALRRFRRTVVRSGLLRELRQRAYYEKPSEKRKRRAREAEMRRRRARRAKHDWLPG